MFHYSRTCNKHLYSSSSSLNEWKGNKSTWLCLVIHSLSAHTSVAAHRWWPNATGITRADFVQLLTHFQQTPLYPSSSSLLKWKTNRSRWLYSVIHWLSAHTSVSARHGWSNATGTSQDHNVPLLTHLQQTPLLQLVLVDQVEEEQATVSLFCYSFTSSAHVGASLLSMITCNRNKPRKFCSIIHSHSTNTFTPPRPHRRRGKTTSQCDSVPLFSQNQQTHQRVLVIAHRTGRGTSHGDWVQLFIHFQQTHVPQLVWLIQWKRDKSWGIRSVIHSVSLHSVVSARHRWPNAIGTSQADFVQLFTNFQQTLVPDLVLVDQVEGEQVTVALFNYSFTFSAHVGPSFSSMIEGKRNKPRS